jgi:hypothetical protein
MQKYTQTQLNEMTVNQRCLKSSHSLTYKLIKTDTIHNAIASHGFSLDKTTTIRPRKTENVGYTKHITRFNPSQDLISRLNLDVSEGIPQLIVINDHNAKSSLRLIIGYLRFVCNNGMVSYNALFERRIRHVGNVETRINSALTELVALFPQFCQHIAKFKSIQLDASQVSQFVTLAGQLMAPKAKLIKNTSLLDVVLRPEDSQNDLWSVLNRIQEKVVTRPIRLEYIIDQVDKSTNQLVEVNKVTRLKISEATKLKNNLALWQHAEKLAA